MHDVNLFAVLVAGIVPMIVGERQPAPCRSRLAVNSAQPR